MAAPAREAFDLILGATTVALPIPQPGQESAQERAQSIQQMADGTIYVYDKAVTNYTGRYTFRLTEAQAADLDAFFKNTAQGGLNTFTVVDHFGNRFSGCRFTEPVLSLSKLASAGFMVTISLDMPSRVK